MARILLVDDGPGMRQVITKILSPGGHTVIVTEEGGKAVAVCLKENPDLVLLDTGLPDLDSREILAGIKKSNPKSKVVVLCGFGDIDTARELLKQGAANYITKPFKVEEFARLVEDTLKGKVASGGQPLKPARRYGLLPWKWFKFSALSVAGLALLSAGGWFGHRYLRKPPPEMDFTVPYANPAAICWDGKHMWTTDWFTETVYQHTTDGVFSVVDSYALPGIVPMGLAYDGKNLWTCSSFERKIYKLGLGEELKIEAEYDSPGPSPAGVFFDGRNLWSADFQKAKVYKFRVDASTFAVAGVYDSPAANPRGMFIYRDSMYIADAKTNRIYQVSLDTFIIRGIYILPQYEEPGAHIAGIAWDGKSLWSCSDGVMKMYRQHITSLKPVNLNPSKS